MIAEQFVKDFAGDVGSLSEHLKALAAFYRGNAPIPGLYGDGAKHRKEVADLLDAAAVYVRLAYEVKVGQDRYDYGWGII